MKAINTLSLLGLFTIYGTLADTINIISSHKSNRNLFIDVRVSELDGFRVLCGNLLLRMRWVSITSLVAKPD